MESAFPCTIIEPSDKDLVFTNKRCEKYCAAFSNVIVLGKALRFVRFMFLIQPFFETFIQGGAALGYRVSRHKCVISDGIKTELLYRRNAFYSKDFLSVKSLNNKAKRSVDKTVIIGTSYYEYGSMSKKSYLEYLERLDAMFPNSEYWMHPRETESTPAVIFGNRALKKSLPSEIEFLNTGMPARLVVALSSTTACTSLMMGSSDVVLLKPSTEWFDGPKTVFMERAGAGPLIKSDITNSDLEEEVLCLLNEMCINNFKVVDVAKTS